MRRKRTRVIPALLLLFVTVAYVEVNFFNHARYALKNPWDSPLRCSYTKEEQAQFFRLTHKVHSTLESLGIEHWLSYGSLWGPLRGMAGPLPWDYDVDLGIDGKDPNFTKLTLEQFKAAFDAQGLRIKDRLLSKSMIAFTETDPGEARVDLFLFYDYSGIMRRAGVESWLFFINYRVYHSFPSRLVKKPLPKTRFGTFNISVPHEGIEVMKYFYPESWSKVVMPPECEIYYSNNFGET